MVDAFGRLINYARVSVVDRCNLRCLYCMPEDGETGFQEPLSQEQLVRVCEALIFLGIQNIKITGGEPLVRNDIGSILRKIKSLEGIKSLTITTNGLLLPELLKEISPGILDGINISLDSVSPKTYKTITRNGNVEDALKGINQVIGGGFKNIKINCVVFEGLNDKEVCDLALLARSKDISLRFIELMPISHGKDYGPFPNKKVVSRLEERFGRLTPAEGSFGNGPAVYFKLQGFLGRIGFISALSHEFCSSCNRVRLTSGGFLKTCLHYRSGVDLRPYMEKGIPIEELAGIMESAVLAKPKGHRFNRPQREDLKHEEEIDGMWLIGG